VLVAGGEQGLGGSRAVLGDLQHAHLIGLEQDAQRRVERSEKPLVGRRGGGLASESVQRTGRVSPGVRCGSQLLCLPRTGSDP
jgi:hypothetical protein